MPCLPTLCSTLIAVVSALRTHLNCDERDKNEEVSQGSEHDDDHDEGEVGNGDGLVVTDEAERVVLRGPGVVSVEGLERLEDLQLHRCCCVQVLVILVSPRHRVASHSGKKAARCTQTASNT